MHESLAEPSVVASRKKGRCGRKPERSNCREYNYSRAFLAARFFGQIVHSKKSSLFIRRLLIVNATIIVDRSSRKMDMLSFHDEYRSFWMSCRAIE
jgi:hypothetical protein